MPNFGFADEQIEDLLVFLAGLTKEPVPANYLPDKTRAGMVAIDEGRLLVARRNCVGCHLIEGEGREIASVVEDPGYLPPNLMGIGARVQPQWIFRFLKDPSSVKIRPWLNLRMPDFQFSDEEAMKVVRYFSELDKVDSGIVTTDDWKSDPELVKVGERLAAPNLFSCYSCHMKGGVRPPGSAIQWGPDLVMARSRIRPGFIPEWVADPQKFTPGVVMPGFLPDDSAAVPDILGGSAKRQAEALEHYIYSLGK